MIRIRGLSKSYGDACAVDRVTFDHAKGETLVIKGPSGSGKTTLLRLIAGLEIPDEGEIFLDSALVSNPDYILPPFKRGIGFVFQRAALWPHMSVGENILFGLKRLSKAQANERLEDILERVELSGLARRYPAQLSGGEARRVSLARALAPHPSLLLMDEPLTHVDPDLKHKLAQLVDESIRQNGTTMVYVTHDVGEVEQISHSRLFEMRDGRLIGGSTPDKGIDRE